MPVTYSKTNWMPETKSPLRRCRGGINNLDDEIVVDPSNNKGKSKTTLEELTEDLLVDDDATANGNCNYFESTTTSSSSQRIDWDIGDANEDENLGCHDDDDDDDNESTNEENSSFVNGHNNNNNNNNNNSQKKNSDDDDDDDTVADVDNDNDDGKNDNKARKTVEVNSMFKSNVTPNDDDANSMNGNDNESATNKEDDNSSEDEEDEDDDDDQTVPLSSSDHEGDLSIGKDNDDDELSVGSEDGDEPHSPEKIDVELPPTSRSTGNTSSDESEPADDDDDDDRKSIDGNEHEQIKSDKAIGNDSDDEEELFMDDASSSPGSAKNDDSDNDDDDDNTESIEKKVGKNAVHKMKKQQHQDKSDEESPRSGRTSRRSVRDRQPRTLLIENDASPKSARPEESEENIPPGEKQKPAMSQKSVNMEEILQATDVIFGSIEDKHTATVKTIITALKDQFSCKITKKLKKRIIDRLKGLINRTIVSHGQEEEEEEQDDADEDTSVVSDQGDPSDSEASDYDDVDRPAKTKRRKPSKGRKGKTKTTKPKSGSKVPNARKAARAARMVEAQRLRKKRMEELRIRNEEMQLNQTKEDQERQDAISAKFETNTEELRLKRLEDRLDLLQRLDEKRILVVAPQMREEHKSADQVEGETSKPGCVDESELDSEGSSEEEDLEIIGMKTTFKPLKPLLNQLPSRGLSVLEEMRSPAKKRSATSTTKAGPPGVRIVSSGSASSGIMMSPGRSMGARFALRNALKQKQRTAGNRWLARELGYKTEEDHLKDCKNLAEQKRELVLKLEQERLKANERKQLRERLLLQEHTVDEGPEEDEDGGETNSHDEGYTSRAEAEDEEEEEDEEMKMAKEIEETREMETKTMGASHDVADQDSHGSDNSQKVTHDSEEEEDTWKAWETQPKEFSTASGNNSIENSLPRKQEESVASENQLQRVKQPLTLSKPDLGDSPSDSQNSVAQSQYLDNQPLDTQQFDGCVGSAQFASEHFDSSKQPPADNSVVTPENADESLAFGNDNSDKEELEFADEKDDADKEAEPDKDPNRPRNAGWQAMLRREAERRKKLKKRKGGLVEEEAEEEEEEEVAGLEDFGFSITKKKKDDDDDDYESDELDEDDLKHVVDEVSDNEGDEDAGRLARKRQEQKEEKERHKEILRRMREGYDGRRGGIAGGGAGARGMHRFDQLVAADNREDAKRLGLLNEDELDSEEENGEEKKEDAEEDEAALLDKMLKDRFMHRSSVELEDENFSDDEDDELEVGGDTVDPANGEDEEEKAQERLAKRFAKRARMQRLEEMYGESQEFSQQRLIDEDTTMKEELKKMRNGLLRRRSTSSSISRCSQSSSNNSSSNLLPAKRHRSTSVSTASSNPKPVGSFFQNSGGSLSIALQASRKMKRQKSSFLGGCKVEGDTEIAGVGLRNVSVNSLMGPTSRSYFGSSSNLSQPGKQKQGPPNASLFSRIVAGRS